MAEESRDRRMREPLGSSEGILCAENFEILMFWTVISGVLRG